MAPREWDATSTQGIQKAFLGRAVMNSKAGAGSHYVKDFQPGARWQCLGTIFVVQTAGKGALLWHLEPVMLEEIPQCPGWPHSRSSVVLNVSSSKAEKPPALDYPQLLPAPKQIQQSYLKRKSAVPLLPCPRVHLR